MPQILVYQSFINNDAFLTWRALRDYFGAQATNFCTASDILNGCLEPGIDLFVMPGGADLYYVEKLGGEPNRRIRAFVESGGRYLGICGGAYYACTEIEYAKDTPYEVTGMRELAFFPGKAIGPLGKSVVFDAEGFTTPEVLTITCNQNPETTKTKALYHGGPVFHFPEDGSDPAPLSGRPAYPEILATYDGPDSHIGLPAIVRVPVGKGHALLCGVHPEIRPHDLDEMAYRKNGTQDPFSQAARALRQIPGEGQELWKQVLDWALPPRP